MYVAFEGKVLNKLILLWIVHVHLEYLDNYMYASFRHKGEKIDCTVSPCCWNQNGMFIYIYVHVKLLNCYEEVFLQKKKYTTFKCTWAKGSSALLWSCVVCCPSVVVNFSHIWLLLWNHWTEFNKTWHEARSQGPLPSLCFLGRSEKQDGCPGLSLAETFSTSPLKLLNGIQQNMTSKISMFSARFVFFRSISIQKLLPWSLCQKGGTLYSGARYVALWASCIITSNDGDLHINFSLLPLV